MPEKGERWGAVVLGFCIGFGFVFGGALGKFALFGALLALRALRQ